MQLVVREFASTPACWDRFAEDTQASFRGAYHASRAWQFEFHLIYRLRRLEVFELTAQGEIKIAQCAVGVGARCGVFSDGLQLAASHQPAWAAVMQAVLRRLGSGCYNYGSHWSLEPSREAELQALEDVELLSVTHSNIEYVDFSSWDSWPAYYSAISTNIRRNVAKSKRNGGDNCIRHTRGLPQVAKLQWLKYVTHRRKQIGGPFLVRMARSVVRLITLFEFFEVATYETAAGTLAAYGGIRFGRNTFYLDGGSVQRNSGAAWHLLITMIERAWWASDGVGAFVMGSDDRTQVGLKFWDGLAKSRRQCRATSSVTCVINFEHHGPAPTPGT